MTALEPLRVAVVSHVRHPIRPPFEGGLEAHSWHLVRALEARGHDVTLFAAGDSDPTFRIHPVLEEHYDRAFPWHRHHGTEALNRHVDAGFAQAARALLDGGFDVVHNNAMHRYPPRLARSRRVPMLSSLHVPPFDALQRAVHASDAPWSLFSVTSKRQRRSWWGDAAPAAARVVHNGIDPAAWPFRARGGGGVVWSGRIAPNKGTHLAAAAARIAGLPLTIHGPIEDRDYFDRLVRPELSGEVRYGGHLDGVALAAALGAADLFAFTPMWDEPFGLAAIEAMACGLPVAAFRSGAAAEVIGPEAGRYATPGDASALARAMRAAMGIDRMVPRRRVEARFTLGRMVDRYAALYREAIAAVGAPWADVEMPPVELRIAPPRLHAAE